MGSVVLVSLAWMPLACAAQDPWATFALDSMAWGVVWSAAWFQHREVRVWLAPAVVWMPITTVLSGIAATGSVA